MNGERVGCLDIMKELKENVDLADALKQNRTKTHECDALCSMRVMMIPIIRSVRELKLKKTPFKHKSAFQKDTNK